MSAPQQPLQGELERAEAALADPYDGLDSRVFGGWRPASQLLWVHRTSEFSGQYDD